MQRGQFTIATAIITALGVVGGAALTSWATASGTINDIKQDVAVISEREDNHYKELREDLSQIRSDIKELLRRTD